jgi:hypothetical protein
MAFLDTGVNFTTIDVPGSFSTNAQGINNSGQIVGYSDLNAAGFLATPVPEPPSSTTLATCFFALFAMACRRKRQPLPRLKSQPQSPCRHFSV